MQARARFPACLESLLRSEIETAIYEANLGAEGTLIAQRYLIERIPQIEIAIELGYDRSSVSRRLKHIIPRVASTADKLKQ